jgi:predicted SAM-dependent methyltransferase
MKKLHLGCGRNLLSGWINTDNHNLSQKHQNFLRTHTIHLDITEHFELESNSIDYVFSEHVIEHITYRDAVNMLTESYRVLKPGGKIRISTPDLNFLIEMYVKPRTELIDSYIQYSINQYSLPGPYDTFVINNFVRDWGHEFIYDKKTLTHAVESIGFTNVTWHNISESDDEHFRNLEDASRLPAGFLQLEKMTMEAIK